MYFSNMYDQIKMSHSTHMLSIQIDTKPSVQQYQIVLFCKPNAKEFSIMYFQGAVRILVDGS